MYPAPHNVTGKDIQPGDNSRIAHRTCISHYPSRDVESTALLLYNPCLPPAFFSPPTNLTMAPASPWPPDFASQNVPKQASRVGKGKNLEGKARIHASSWEEPAWEHMLLKVLSFSPLLMLRCAGHCAVLPHRTSCTQNSCVPGIEIFILLKTEKVGNLPGIMWWRGC